MLIQLCTLHQGPGGHASARFHGAKSSEATITHTDKIKIFYLNLIFPQGSDFLFRCVSFFSLPRTDSFTFLPLDYLICTHFAHARSASSPWRSLFIQAFPLPSLPPRDVRKFLLPSDWIFKDGGPGKGHRPLIPKEGVLSQAIFLTYYSEQ